MKRVCSAPAILALASFVILVPPAAWFIVNHSGSGIFARNTDEFTGPLTYLATVSIALAAVVLVAVAIRRRSVSYVAWLGVLVGIAALAAAATALGLTMLPRPAVIGEPTPVIDRTEFTKMYYEMHRAINSLGNGEPVMRRSFDKDEYGIVPRDTTASARDHWVHWEEYGWPLRCFRSPRGSDWVQWKEIIPQLQLMPLSFTLNTLGYACLVLSLLLIPKWITARYRRQEGRCIKCGYLLKGLTRCPECGEQSVAQCPSAAARHENQGGNSVG